MQRTEAEEHLRVIRSLMEKATIYRAVSAPTALLGGSLSVLVGVLLAGPFRETAEHPTWFFGPWLAVLAFTAAANGYFIRRDAMRRGDPFVSPGMKMALRALAPAHLVAGFFTLLAMVGTGGPVTARSYLALPAAWCLAYGLGLLAMAHFAPRSLMWLGWCFVFAGLASAAILFFGPGVLLPTGLTPTQFANVTMACTFGALHLVYAACAWPRAERAEQGVHA